MARSSWKYKYINNTVYNYVFLSKLVRTVKLKKFFCRSSVIPKLFLKKNIFIYKGNIFNNFFFTKYTLGYRLGEFSFTRKPFSYPLKKKKR